VHGDTSTPTGILSSSTIEVELLDLVLSIKQSRLITDLCGKPGESGGLLAILKTAAKTIKPTPATQPILTAVGPYTPGSHHIPMKDLLTQFQKLIQLVQNTVHHEKGRKAKTKINFSVTKEAILLAYKLQSDQTLKHSLSQSGSCGIRKLSRYWWYCLELLRCARSMTVLKNIEFVAVPAFDIRLPPQAGLSISQNLIPTVNRLLISMGFTLADLQAYCKHTRLREADLWHGMETSLRTPPYMHAEVALVYFYALHTDLQPEVEIGCSKNACFACNTPKNHPSFKVGKSHTEISALPAQKSSSKAVVAPELETRIIPVFMGVLRQALITILRTTAENDSGNSGGIVISCQDSYTTGVDGTSGTSDKNDEPSRMEEGNVVSMLVENMRAFVLGLDDVEDEVLCETEADTTASSIPGRYPGKLRFVPQHAYDL